MTEQAAAASVAASKVIVQACAWVESRRAAQSAHPEHKARAVGRLKASGDQLAEAVEKYCVETQKAGA